MRFKILIFAVLLFGVSAAKGETALKLNGLYALGGVVSPAAEIGVAKNFTVEMNAVGAFYQAISLGEKIKEMPLLLGLGFLEMHWFPKEKFRGFYVGPSAGWGIYKIQKWDYWGTDSYQNGSSIFLGLTLGYQWRKGNWLFDLTAAGGWQYGIYEGYNRATNSRYEIGKFPGKYNISAEWIPYKFGLMVGYIF